MIGWTATDDLLQKLSLFMVNKIFTFILCVFFPPFIYWWPPALYTHALYFLIEWFIQIAQYIATEVTLWLCRSRFICCNGSLSCCMCQKGQTLCSPFHSSSSAPPSLSGLCMSCPRGAIGVCVRVFVCDQVCTRAKWTEWGGGREEWGHSFERIKLKLHVRGPLAPAPGREITVIHC